MASPCAGRTIRIGDAPSRLHGSRMLGFRVTGGALLLIAMVLLAILAMPGLAAAQTLLITQPTFPLTPVGQSVTENFVITINSGGNSVVFNSFALAPGFSDFTLGTITGCTVDGITINTSGAVCTVPITFAPKLPGNASAPMPVARSAPLLVSDVENGGPVQYAFGVTGSGTSPLPVILPGIISDIVGNDVAAMNDLAPPSGYAGDGGPASGAVFNGPTSLAVDNAGNIYISDTGNCVVRRVDKVLQTINTVAGVGQTCGQGIDGEAATASLLSGNTGIALDAAGNLYIVDTGNSAVREVSAATGLIQTVAGTLNASGFSGDNGLATTALLSNPISIAVDGYGNLYIGDAGNQAVRKVQLSTGIITTIATPVYATGITVDSLGDVFIADQNTASILRVDAVTQAITTWNDLGSSIESVAGNLAIDASDTLHFTLQGSNDIYKLPPGSEAPIIEAGSNLGLVGNRFGTGDGGPATQAGLNIPSAVVVDGTGSLYILEADGVRFVDSTGTQPTQVNFAPVAPLSTSSPPQNILLFNGDIATPVGGVPNPLDVYFNGLSEPFATVPVTQGQDCSMASMVTDIQLNPAAFCTLSMIFTPQQNGGVSSSTSLFETSSATPLTQTINLIAVGGTAAVTLTPSQLTFLDSVGVTTPPQVLTLTNNMPNSIAITGMSFVTNAAGGTSWAETNNCPAMLAGNSSCSIAVTYTPSGGVLFNNLDVYYLLSPGQGNYSGYVQADTEGDGFNGGGNLNPSSVAFGQQSVGSTSAPIAVELSSTGAPPTYTWPLVINSITIGGNDASQFAISGTNCGLTVAVGSSCTIYVEFKPLTDSPAGGTQPFSATLNVAFNSGNSTSLSIPLSGFGTGAAPLAISETITLSDASALVPATPFAITETVHLSDTSALMAQTPLAISESINLSDSPAAVVPTQLMIAEMINLTDAPALTASVPLAINETISLSDSPAVVLPTPLMIAEMVHLSDAPTLTASIPLSFSETIHIADTPDAVEALLVPVTETIHISDTPAAIHSLVVAIAEAVHVTDAPSTTLSLLVPVSESVHIIDTPAVTASLLVPVNEAIHITDNPAMIQSLLVPITETIRISDFPAAVESLLVPVTETIHILYAPANIESLLVPIAETIHITDTPANFESLLVPVTETIHISDVPAPVESLLIPVTETIHILDAPADIESLLVPIAETIHIADTPATIESLLVPVTETIHISDIPAAVESLFVPVTETIHILDAPADIESLLVPIAETIHITDAPAIIESLLVPVIETIHTTDIPAVVESLFVPVTETIHILDAPANIESLLVPIAETIHIIDAQANIESLLVPVSEIIHTADTPAPVESLLVPVSEIVHITDAPAVIESLLVPVTETIHITDTPATIQSLLVPITEAIHATDTPTVVESLLVPVTETIQIIDTPANIESLLVPVSEIIQIADTPAAVESLAVPVSEIVHITDTPAVIESHLVPVTETIHIADAPAMIQSLLVPIAETIHATDIPAVVGSLFVPVTEMIHIIDAPANIESLLVPIAENIHITATPDWP